MVAKKTSFYNKHVEYGAKIVPFAGYLMPIQYTGIIDEHLTVRNNVGVFDVSHMGEFLVTGENAENFLNNLTVNNVEKLEVGQIQYSAMCYPDGGIVDDLLVYKFKDYYLMVVNASNIEKDYAWALENLMDNVELKNISENTALLAVQGPQSFKTLQKLTEVNLSEIPFYHFKEDKLAGEKLIISRTGYTGEMGFELYHNPKDSEKLWNEIFKAGEEFGIKPVGLGCRDTLRLEMKYALYGNDIDKTTNPLEAGLGWITKLKKNGFIGQEALQQIKEQGLKRRNVAFELTERGIPRQGYKIFKDGEEIGNVTSGTMSPSLKKGIGTGYVAKAFQKSGTEIEIEMRGKFVKAVIVKPPFVPSRTS